MNNTNNIVFLQQSFFAPNNTKSFVMEISEKVRQLRTMRGWTQEELAKAAGVKQQNIQQLEDGAIKRPRYLPELARALNVTVESLITDDEKPQPLAYLSAHYLADSAVQSPSNEPRSISGLLQSLHPDLVTAPKDMREAIEALVLTYQADPKEGERVAKAIKTLLKKDP